MLFVNSDNPLLMRLSDNCKKKTYGSTSNADIEGELGSILPSLSLSFKDPESSSKTECETKIIGEHNFENTFKFQPQSIEASPLKLQLSSRNGNPCQYIHLALEI